MNENTWTIEIKQPTGETELLPLPQTPQEWTLGRHPSCFVHLRDSSLPEVVGKIQHRPSGNPNSSPYWIQAQGTTPIQMVDFQVYDAHWPENFTLRLGACEVRLLRTTPSTIRSLPPTPMGCKPWLTQTEEGAQLLWDVKKSALTGLAVFLEGETGVGKEVLAQMVHASSPRARSPFVALNCGALPVSLAESELFGHVKGAFTGADQARTGAFMQAHCGTLFLDEVGDLPLDIQVKLLRFLENGEVRPVGSDRSSRVDVRLICATHKPLQELVREKKFRLDLYYRIASITLRIPPLRSRPDDIEYLAKKFAADLGKQITESGLRRLLEHNWPGNVRELRHAIERASAQGGPIQSVITLADFSFLSEGTRMNPDEEDSNSSPSTLNLESLERSTLIRALKVHRGNREKAALSLGVARSTIFEMMKRHGVHGPRSTQAFYY